jgi:cytochrome c-type biogenesis protein CcmH
MTVLAVIAVLLALSTAWLVARPLFRTVPVVADEQRQQLEVVRDRLVAQLDELDLDRADQGVDAQVAADEQRRLEFELASVLKRLDASVTERQAPVASAPGRVRAMAVLLLLVVPLAALGLYFVQNRTMLQTFANLDRNTAVTAKEMPPMVMEMVKRLETRLAENPNDAQGWAQLGRSYAVLERRDEAKEAYGKAYALAPTDVDIVGEYAWLVYSEDPTQTEGLVVQLYSQLYKLDPKHQDAMWVLGLAAFNKGEFAKATGYWDKLLASLPADTPAREAIRKAIDQAKAHAGRK